MTTLNIELVRKNMQLFLATDAFPDALSNLKYAQSDSMDELLATPSYFERYLFSVWGMAFVSCLVSKEAAFSEKALAALSPPRAYGETIKTLLRERGQLEECFRLCMPYGISKDDVRSCAQHYLDHMETSYRLNWHVQDHWGTLDLAEKDPYAPAHRLISLIRTRGSNFKDPLVLDALAKINFDPMNNAVVEDFIRAECGAPFLKSVRQEVQNYLRQGDDDQLTDLRDLLNEKIPPIDWMVAGTFAKSSMSILSGAPKSGKSTLIRWLIYALSTAKPWLSRDVSTPRKVAYYCCDDPKPLFRQVMANLYQGVLPPEESTPQVQFSINPALLLMRLEEAVACGCEFIIIDTLFQALSTTDSNSYSEMTTVLGTLSRFAKQHHIHLLLIHHNTKSSAGSGASSGILGSVALAGATDVNIVLTHDTDHEGHEVRRIYSENRYPDFLGGKVFTGEQVQADSTSCTLTKAMPKTERKAKQKQSQDMQTTVKIVSLLLSQHPVGFSKTEMREQVGGDNNRIKKLIDWGLGQQILAESATKKKGAPLIILHPRFEDPEGKINQDALSTALGNVTLSTFAAAGGEPVC